MFRSSAKSISIALGVLFSIPAFCESGPPLLPHYHLKGDTRACHGYLKISDTLLDWKSSWTHWKCAYHLRDHENIRSTWILETKITKACPVSIIEIRLEFPDQADEPNAPREVIAYATRDEFSRGKKAAPQLDCNMQ